MERKERLKGVYNYLRNNGLVHTQKDFAEEIGASPANLSRAFNGDDKALTDSLMKRIVARYVAIREEWLLTGEGEMLRAESGAPRSMESQESKKERGADADLQRKLVLLQADLDLANVELQYRDSVIQAQQETIEALKDHIATLKKTKNLE